MMMRGRERGSALIARTAPPPHPPAARVPPSPPRGAERVGVRWGDESSASRPEKPQHHLRRVAEVLAAGGGAVEGAAEDGGKRVQVGEVEEAQRGDGDVELGRIDAGAEDAGAAAALEKAGDDVQQRAVHVANLARAAQIARAVQVLAEQQGDEFRMRVVVFEGEGDEAAHAFDRREALDIEATLLAADAQIGLFKDG